MENFKAIIRAVACKRWWFMRGSNCSSFTLKSVSNKWSPVGGGGFMQEVVNDGSSTAVSSKSHIFS